MPSVSTRTVWRALVAALVCVGVLAGASRVSNPQTGFNAALLNRVGNNPIAGQTLVLGSTSDCDSYDPAQVSMQWCAVIHRMYSRNLMAFASAPGTEGLGLVPDLLAKRPTHSADYTVWTFELQKNLKWNDGQTITSKDVRYSIERLFKRELNVRLSPQYLCLFSECTNFAPKYLGPNPGNSNHMRAIDIKSDQKFTITLNRPYADFPYVLAMPQLAPVQQSRAFSSDFGSSAYASDPSSSGPFEIKSIKPGKLIDFVRNPEWKASTDAVRAPLVDEVTLRIFADNAGIKEAIATQAIDMKIDGGLDSETATWINDEPARRAYADAPLTTYTNFVALNPGIAPLDNAACREAIFYSINKSALAGLKADGLNAQVANTMTPPGVVGFDAAAHTYVTADGKGDLSLAHDKLAECGYPGGFEITMAYPTIGLGSAQFEAVRESLARVGIVVSPKSYGSVEEYFTSGIGSPDSVKQNNIGLVVGGWGSLNPSPLSFWSSLVDGRKITSLANVNFPELYNDDINARLDEIELGTSDSDPAQVTGEIEKLVSDQAVYLPVSYGRQYMYRAPRLVNVYVHQALGNEYDIVNVGIRAHK